LTPFTIRLVDRTVEKSVLQPVRIKLDPGSRTTGIALVRDGETGRTAHVLFLAELHHRGQVIRDALTQRRTFRRRRRTVNLRYRAKRFDNRRRPQGWLAPSLRHRIETTVSWVKRVRRWTPVAAISQELVRFDTQKLQNSEISGVEYQRGTLFGYEVREYLLEKWERTCGYCGARSVPLEIEHIRPKSQGGSDRISNLTLACNRCNKRKGNKSIEEFPAHDPKRLAQVKGQAKATLKDAAALNSTRWALWRQLQETGLEKDGLCRCCESKLPGAETTSAHVLIVSVFQEAA
jgi:5-methylcytosine-specific restriction endonuclease McrA